ncbi:beta-galactosidase [Streptomyces sp. NPDC049627]|uniref:beta-galactosidase n=1 Tax=Streptomyces sp. NPDC049627 TaxID=3365595 RepID=UPI00378DD8D3
MGFAWDNRLGYDGQWRQAAWAHVARGPRMIEYWQWQTLRFGAETYWSGVLPHSGPARPYVRRTRPPGRRVRQGGPARGRDRTGRRSRDGLLDAEQVADAEVPAPRDPGRAAGTRRRTTASSTRSIAVPSRRAARYGSCMPGSCPTRRRRRPYGVTRS